MLRTQLGQIREFYTERNVGKKAAILHSMKSDVA